MVIFEHELTKPDTELALTQHHLSQWNIDVTCNDHRRLVPGAIKMETLLSTVIT